MSIALWLASCGDDSTVLKEVNFSLNEGEFVSILGPSGSGKSTLMNIIGCLDVPTSGEYTLNGHAVEELDESELAQARNSEIGFVLQQFQLLPRLSALQNVELPLIYSGIPGKEGKKMAADIGVSFLVPAYSIALAIGFSAIIGIVFGYSPARKASRLNPIDALRSA